MHPVSALIKDLYAMRESNQIDDAEARWILSIVLPFYGLSLTDLAKLLTRSTDVQ